MVYKRVQLKPGKEASLQRFHPWIFSGAVRSVEEKPEEGEVVDVFTAQNEFIARGHYQQGSITVRVLTFQQKEIDTDFWYSKLKSAYDMRVTLGLAESIITNAYRLVYGEGDGLPGLIIDVYNHTAVMQTHTVGMHQSRKEIADALMKLMGNKLKNIYYKSEATLAAQEKMSSTDGYLKGGCDENIAMENGLKFHVDWLKGQKTGFFVDQRENRALVERYAKGKTVLNMFCYTGGFSFYALRGGAKLVHSVDSSAKAIELTNRNVELNFPNCACHQAFVDDAFKFLNGMNDTYDLIILDPPAFAKHKAAIRNALKGYSRLNAKAFEKIRHGGLLFTFSCSQLVDKISFRNAVLTAAVQSGRSVRILHQLTQPADHPINIFHPEGEYLKGLVVYVE
ncbi:MAG: class I SAM-dependent rRNA methyltransferase [Phocaeicola sp.]|uniref:class I SAM-dependent rRNA methyltransferase n=1 Tax=Phocaeicola sp. TaxID=2773926 RepID=UPI003F9FD33D